jgi:Uma2 family endonuclease
MHPRGAGGGNPRVPVSPDVFAVKGVPKHQRLIYKLWEEAASPCFVIEVTSSCTWRIDAGSCIWVCVCATQPCPC